MSVGDCGKEGGDRAVTKPESQAEATITITHGFGEQRPSGYHVVSTVLGAVATKQTGGLPALSGSHSHKPRGARSNRSSVKSPRAKDTVRTW